MYLFTCKIYSHFILNLVITSFLSLAARLTSSGKYAEQLSSQHHKVLIVIFLQLVANCIVSFDHKSSVAVVICHSFAGWVVKQQAVNESSRCTTETSAYCR